MGGIALWRDGGRHIGQDKLHADYVATSCQGGELGVPPH